jgi:hypothetical protein
MLSTTKIRTTVLATMGTAIMTATLALVLASPADARMICKGKLCRAAAPCKHTFKDGMVVWYEDEVTETFGKKKWECRDGKWVVVTRSGEGSQPEGPPKAIQPPETTPPPSRPEGPPVAK